MSDRHLQKYPHTIGQSAQDLNIRRFSSAPKMFKMISEPIDASDSEPVVETGVPGVATNVHGPYEESRNIISESIDPVQNYSRCKSTAQSELDSMFQKHVIESTAQQRQSLHQYGSTF